MKYIPLSNLEGYEDFIHYMISDTGEVWSKKRKGPLHKLTPGRIRGYKTVWLYDKNKKKRVVQLGQLIATAFIPNVTGSVKIRFKDRDRSNCVVDNIEWIPYTRKGFTKVKVPDRIKMTEYLEKNAIYMNEDVVSKLKMVYEATRLKGGIVPTSTEFFNQFINEALDNYINVKGLKRVMYQMNSEHNF